MQGWEKKKVLITVRTYPVPASKGVEVSCTAGVTDDGKWIRLFPVPYRFLTEDKRFTRYQWIDVEVMKPRSDPRPDSFTLRIDSIRIGSFVPPKDGWRARKDLIFPLKRDSLCRIAEERHTGGSTLGLFKPAKILRLTITPAKPLTWTPKQMAILNQGRLGLETGPTKALEKIPFDFKYEFLCNTPSCKGHKMTCIDWEIGESYRSWRVRYGDRWEDMFRQRYERDMITKRDTYFYVGNIHQHQNNWLIVGLFYPPKAGADLFD